MTTPKEQSRLEKLQAYERDLWAQGFVHLAGVDEVGLGPLAGPVVAGACILPRDFMPSGINDSKKLTPAKREALEPELQAHAIAWALGEASVEEVERLNPYQAAVLAMRRAVDALSVPPDHLLIDAKKLPHLAIPQLALIKGDALSMSIAAASILAKTHRDRLMVQLGTQYPGYGIESHMGYSTPEHLEALRRLGPSPIHRKTYAPVREALGLLPKQSALPF